MKILLFGANGQVGWELQRSLLPLGELVALDRRSVTWCGDLSDAVGLAETVHKLSPDVIVNAAAYTAVDMAEKDHETAHAVNAVAPGVLADAASSVGAWLVHYSTDYVFDGSGSKPWEESDPTGPLGVYGSTKLEGERRIEARCARHVVLRTSWVYAARGANFPATVLRLAGEQDRLSVVDDQFGAPTGADLLADVTAHIVRGLVTGADHAAGTYHLAAAGETSWHGYARFVMESALQSGRTLKASPMTIDPVPANAYPTAAARPRNSRLNTAKLRTKFALTLPDWRSGVARMLAEIPRHTP